MSSKLTAIPTNVITGFLGVGKTTAILHLLKHKPSHERWAVLVNEFGEIGIDGGFIEGAHPESRGVYIKEVPGGCMCCASGLPMQIALHQLLKRARPDRLLIEPTGLGHPKEVIKVLSEAHYTDVLYLQRTLTFVDARQLANPRYTEHDIFNQQLDVADVVIANKADLYQNQDAELHALHAYLDARNKTDIPVFLSVDGAIPLTVLAGVSQSNNIQPSDNAHIHHSHKPNNVELSDDKPLPACGYIESVRTQAPFMSIGWRFSADIIFCRKQLVSYFSGLTLERLKAVMITEEGIYGYNASRYGQNITLTEMYLDDCSESRAEMICSESDARSLPSVEDLMGLANRRGM